MKNKNYLMFSVLFLMIISLNLSSAWIVPDSHDYIAKQALLEAPDSTYGKIVTEHFDDFSACMSVTDYSVFFYFQQGFSTIGKVYLASHNNLICSRALELADKNDPSQVACAIGICSMDAEDSPSHNGFIPSVVRDSGLVNGLVHAPAEQCVNNRISTKSLQSEGRSSLINKYPEHKQFLIKVFEGDERTSQINVGLMMDAFVAEVASSDQYTVGFRGFTAVPLTVHVILLLWFLFGVITLTYLIRVKNKNLFNKISMLVLIFLFILPVILVYVLYFTGNIWQTFQFATNTVLCPILPTEGYQTYLTQAVHNEVNLFNNGAIIFNQIPDPAGKLALANADSSNTWKLWAIGFILAIFIALFAWLNIRKKR